MHLLTVVQEIDRLLKEGQLSQRRIAERLGVSRGTVSEIANGKRGLHGRSSEKDGVAEGCDLPAARCPKCGFFVYLPCLVCRTREYRYGRRVLAALAAKGQLGSRRRRLPMRRRRRVCRTRVA